MNIRERREEGIKLAKRLGIKDQELFELIRSNCWDAILEKAMEISPKKTEKALIILIKNKDLSMHDCWYIAVSRHTPARIQRKLARHKDSSIRCAVAENIYVTPLKTLRKLTRDRSKLVCEAAEDSLKSLKTESFKTIFGSGGIRTYP